MTHNEKLKIVRQELKLTQAEMAAKFSIKQSYYSAIERGEKPISTNIIDVLFTSLNVSSQWFYHDIGDIFNNANGAIAWFGDSRVFNVDMSRPTRYAQNLTEQQINFELTHALEQLKEVFNDKKLLTETLHKFNAPDFLIEKFPLQPTFIKYKKEIEKEFEEEFGHLDKKEKNIGMINHLYHSNIEHQRQMLSMLIKYMHTYSDFIIDAISDDASKRKKK